MKLKDALTKTTTGPMEEGDCIAWVFANAILIKTMEEGQHLKIQVVGIRPEDRFDEPIDDIFAEAGED